MRGFTWNEKATERLKALWPDKNLRATDIAKILTEEYGHRLTRNAVIGRAFRIGLPDKPANGFNRSPIPRESRPVRLANPLPPEPEIEIIGIEPVELVRGQCAWPVGDPKEPGFKYCGRPVLGSGPYCACHQEKAWLRGHKRHMNSWNNPPPQGQDIYMPIEELQELLGA
jgi:GcrA cell cycle regulator